jgi:hypothetical protein
MPPSFATIMRRAGELLRANLSLKARRYRQRLRPTTGRLQWRLSTCARLARRTLRRQQVRQSLARTQWKQRGPSIGGDCKKAINLVPSSADASPPYGFMLLPGTTSSGFAMKLSSFSLSQTKSAPFIALE